MIIKFNKIAALIVSLAIIGLAFISFAVKIMMSSLPPEFEEFKSDKIAKEVEMYRNDYGLPFIVSDSERDMFFMLGYSQAQDRLWQMDYLRRSAKGELSQIFGADKLVYDKFIRSFDVEKYAKACWRVMGPESRSALTAFSEGVNLFIDKHKKKLPLEFASLDYIPEKWDPVDCISIYKMSALQLSPGFRQDLLMGEIADKFGIDKAKALIPKYPETAPYVYERAPAAKAKTATDSAQISKPANLASKRGLGEFYKAFAAQLDSMGLNNTSLGSNAWAINKMSDSKAKAVLANDPHLTLTNPSVWYQAKLSSPNYNAIGMMLVGTPLMLIGRNDNISWGIANSMADDFDYFFEKTDPKDSKKFIADSASRKFKFAIDTIKIKSKPDYVYYKRYATRSCVISDFYIDNKYAAKKGNNYKPQSIANADDFYEKYCITFKWTGQPPSDEVSALYSINKAKSWEQFKNGVRRFKSPAFNFLYADKQGNIGALLSGTIPVRKEGCNPNLPNPGWLSSADWSGTLPSEEMPEALNPEQKHIIAANNKLFHTKSTFISNYWDNPSRATRIDSLLNQVYSYSARDAQIMQYDLLSPYALQVLDKLIPVLNKSYSGLTLTEKQALERLKKWDGIMHADVPSSAIFNEVYMQLLKMAFLDDLGETYFSKYISMQNFASTRLMELLENPNDQFVVNYRNQNIKTIESLLIYAFRAAIDNLQTTFASMNPVDWKYGNLHYLELKHPLAGNPLLRPSFTMERFRMGGNFTTINNTAYDASKSYEASVGASCRFISDMGEPYVYLSIPGGVSGQLYSANFADQMQLWVFGGYVKINVSREPDESFKKATKIQYGEEKK
jgi:penicillin amidase